ncbi:MAG: nucleotidyl transferase AbiEii/AbiGii toxin family protein [Patescibacteria group bacterium]
MHREILTKEQIELLPVISKFKGDFGLVGGTAAALHIGHRRSIDFDMFSLKSFVNEDIRKILTSAFPIEQELVDRDGEYTIKINSVKATFYQYRIPIDFPDVFENSMRVADLVTIAAMKIHALGSRAKWKDYVDLYFILKNKHTIDELDAKAHEILHGEFNARLFRQRLALFFDIRYDEQVEFMPGFEVSSREIKEYLREVSLS